MSATPKRPKYSTGFKLFVGGMAMVFLGLALSSKVSGPWGVILFAIGGFLMVCFRYSSDWRKTWPEDFPLTRRLLRRPPPAPTAQEQIDSAHQLNEPEEGSEGQAESQNWWNTAPPSTRRRWAVALMLAGMAFFLWGASDPTNYHGHTSHVYGLVSGAFFMVFGFVQFRGARSDRD